MQKNQEIDLGEVEKRAGDSPSTAKFLAFFETVYKKKIERLVEAYPEKRSLDIDFRELEKFDFVLADDLIERPDLLLEAAEKAIETIEVPALEIDEFKPHIRFYNLPKDRELLIKEIGSRNLGKLVSVEGIVRQITDVLPRIKTAFWECRKCSATYRIAQDSQQLKSPVICESCRGRDFSMAQEHSEFIDYQKIQIQEPLERLKGNEQASYLDAYVSDDLVNLITAGDKTRFVGILRLYPAKERKVVYGRFLEAIHLEETEREFSEVEITPEEEKTIRELSENPKVYEMLTKSVAPAIYGHEIVKEAIVLQLFGGVRKALPNNPSLRGNVHILLVGEPSTGKSQLLQATHDISPKSIYFAGKTTTGVGLCVAPDSLVLNSNGFKEIKEFVEENFDSTLAQEEIPNAFSNDFSGTAATLNDNLIIKESKLYKIWRIKAPEKMINLKTWSGKEIELTPNTPVIRIKNSQIEWVKASEVNERDFIATARTLPEGRLSNYPTIIVLYQNKNIRIRDNVFEIFKEITDKLITSYGTVQNVAKRLGVPRERLYLWRSRDFSSGIPLNAFVTLGIEANYSFDELSKHVNEVFLSYGKNIKIPRYLDNEKIAYLAGLALGDGNVYLRKNSSSIRIFNTSEQILKNVDTIVREAFEIETEKINDKKRCPARRFASIPIYNMLNAYGLVKEKNRIRISHTASEFSNKIVAKILQGLFDTDGYAAKSNQGSAHIGLATISRDLAKTVQLCLLKFGIHAKSRIRAKAGTIASGKEIGIKSNYGQYAIEIRGKENLQKFEEKIGFDLERKRKALREIISATTKPDTNIDIVPEIKEVLKGIPHTWRAGSGKSNFSKQKLKELLEKAKKKNGFLQRLADSDVWWERIVEKRKFKPLYEFVYDFSVKETHNFIANGIFVHNTATAVKDEFGEGGWTLKAGALVLASGGTCMADELDKLDPEERSALHEAMEQGMISVAKAGIVTRFKADTSILAASNPKFARFDPYSPFIEQLNLPLSLISRFDLFFMIRDVLDRTKDEAIAEHILHTHRSGELISQYARKGKALKQAMKQEMQALTTPAINAETMRKYVSFARQNVFPTLSKEAIHLISDFYVNLREQGKSEGSYAATHRQLEGLVRLSEASARVRLSDVVELEDAERAVRLLRASLEDVVTDPETGRIDFDIIATGKTHTQLTNIKKILKIIKQKAQDMDMVPVQDVIEEAKQEGIEEEKTKETIEELTRKGEIYSPRHHFVKPTQKQ